MLFPNKENTPTYGLNVLFDYDEIGDGDDIFYVSESDTYLPYCDIFKNITNIKKNGYSSVIKYKDIDFDRFKDIKERVINEVRRNIFEIHRIAKDNPDLDKWDIYKIVDDESMKAGIPDIFNIRYQVSRQLPWYEAGENEPFDFNINDMPEEIYKSLGSGVLLIVDLDENGKIVYTHGSMKYAFGDAGNLYLNGSFEENIKSLNLDDNDLLCAVEVHY